MARGRQWPAEARDSQKAILHLNAIVMTMEMDKLRSDTAPSVAGMQAVVEV